MNGLNRIVLKREKRFNKKERCDHHSPSTRGRERMKQMKLPVQRAALPGNVVSFYIVPFPACPAYRRQAVGRDPADLAKSGTGHLPVKG